MWAFGDPDFDEHRDSRPDYRGNLFNGDWSGSDFPSDSPPAIDPGVPRYDYRNGRLLYMSAATFFALLCYVPKALEIAFWCCWHAFAYLADRCTRVSDWFLLRANVPLVLADTRRTPATAPVAWIVRDEGDQREAASMATRLPRLRPRPAVETLSEDLVRGVRKMAEHLEEYAEKGLVREGAYTQLYDDLMAIHNAARADGLAQ